jgi:chorismate dehydratase
MRISAISYLNTAPLMWDFEHGSVGEDFDISYTVPSQCAVELQKGKADIGIIPSAAYPAISGLSILPGVAIASKREVRSILLVSCKPMDAIRTVALDSSSITSVALARILFEKVWGGQREYGSVTPYLKTMLSQHDAALLIGDPALQVDRSQYNTWDLAEEWIRFTNKPFVFAFWAVRQDALRNSTLDLPFIFQQSRDHGVQPNNISEIAATWSRRLAKTETDLRSYLTRNIHYYLDEECLVGLRLFYQLGHECGALASPADLEFVRPQPALT